MALKIENTYLFNPGIRNGGDLFYYLWMFLSLPIIISILFFSRYILSVQIKEYGIIYIGNFSIFCTGILYLHIPRFTNEQMERGLQFDYRVSGFCTLFLPTN